MDVLIGAVVVVAIATIGGTMAFFRRRGKSRSDSSEQSYKAGKQRGSVDSKLDQIIDHQLITDTKVDRMALEITTSVTWGKANSEGIQRLTDRFDRHIDRPAGDD